MVIIDAMLRKTQICKVLIACPAETAMYDIDNKDGHIKYPHSYHTSQWKHRNYSMKLISKTFIKFTAIVNWVEKYEKIVFIKFSAQSTCYTNKIETKDDPQGCKETEGNCCWSTPGHLAPPEHYDPV